MKTKINTFRIIIITGIGLIAVVSISLLPKLSEVSASTAGLLPSGDGNYEQWIRHTSGSTHYTAVDESECNGNTDFIYTATTGQRESFSVDLSSITDGSVVLDMGIVPCASKHADTGSSTMNVFFRWDSTNSPDMGNYNLSTTNPTYLNSVTAYNLGFIKTASTTLEIGSVYTSGNDGVRLSQIATVITYISPEILWQKCDPDEETQCDVWKMNPDGSNATNLTSNTSSYFDFDPQWSRDHSKIVFTSDRNGNPDIFTMNYDGTGVTALTSSSAFETFGTFSPDGTRIAFTRAVAGKNQVFIMDSDGTDVTQLTNNSYNNEEPAFSTDGTQILFDSDRDGDYEIFIMGVDGSNQTALTSNSASDRYPAWSLDGTKIAFASDRDGSNYEIYTMNSDGSSQTRRTTNTVIDSDPVWFADGSSIYFASTRDGNAELYIMNADGTGQTRITNNSVFDAGPDW